MIELMQSVFGTYTPNTYIQNVYDSSGQLIDQVEVIAQGAAGVDWTYVGGIVLFGVALFCVFRLIGSILKNS